jgi:hypothetical protein
MDDLTIDDGATAAVMDWRQRRRAGDVLAVT